MTRGRKVLEPVRSYNMVFPGVACGLRSVGSCVPGWEYLVDDIAKDSRLGVFRGGVSEGLQKQVMREASLSDVSWKLVGRTPRWTQWLTRSGCSCPYTYGGDVVLPQEFPAWVVDVMREVMPKCGLTVEAQWPDSCNVNWYDGGLQGCGWHRDDEALFQGLHQGCLIISVSFGASRTFQVRRFGDSKRSRVRLGAGDVCTMEGMMQKYYEHGAPLEANVSGARLNLTFRWVKRHTRGCACCALGSVKDLVPVEALAECKESSCAKVVQH